MARRNAVMFHLVGAAHPTLKVAGQAPDVVTKETAGGGRYKTGNSVDERA